MSTPTVRVTTKRRGRQIEKIIPQLANCHNLMPVELNSHFSLTQKMTQTCSKLNRGTIMMILVNYHEFFSRLFNRLRSLTSYPAFPSSEKLPLTLPSLNALKLKQQKPLVIFQIIHSVFDSFSPSTYHFSHSTSKSYLP